MLIWIELCVVAAITGLFLLSAFFWLKPEHVDHDPVRVRIGAAIQGLIIGLLVGFVVLPLRLVFFLPDPAIVGPAIVGEAPRQPSSGIASISLLPVLVLLIIVRRGLLARAPVIGLYLRAYRKAVLKQQIASAQWALARLVRMDADEKA